MTVGTSMVQTSSTHHRNGPEADRVAPFSTADAAKQAAGTAPLPGTTGAGLQFVVCPAAQGCEQLQQRIATLEAFVESFSAIAHDMRNSLALIRGSSQLLADTESGEGAFYAGLVSEETVHLGRLTEDLLDLSRFNLGKFKLTRQWTDLSTLAESVAEMAGTLSSQHQVVVDVPAGLPPVFIDATRMRQVLTNLLINAINYSPAGGIVRLAISRDPEVAQALFVSVEDQGTGIAPEVLPNLFTPFASGPADPAIKKNGLGLAVCKSIVEAHGGQIWATSHAGLGTTFTFTIPRIDAVADESGL